MQRWWKILVDAGKRWNDDNNFKHCAAVSFYTVFSLAPITVIAAAIAGFFMGQARASQALQGQIATVLGAQTAQMIADAVKASESYSKNVWSTVVGIALILIGATSVFSQLQSSLNEIWSVRPKPSESGWLIFIMQRVMSFAMVLTIGFVLLVSLVVSTALNAATKSWVTGLGPLLAQSADFIVGLAAITALFAMIFKYLPDVQLRWKDVWTSAFVTAVLFGVGRFGIALYLAHSTVASIYGAAGSLAALLVWVYYSCAILFYGVEFARAEHNLAGHKVLPKRTAVAIRTEMVEKGHTPVPTHAHVEGQPQPDGKRAAGAAAVSEARRGSARAGER